MCRFESLISEIQSSYEHRLDLSGAMGSSTGGIRSKKSSVVAAMVVTAAGQEQGGLAAAAAAPPVHTSLRTRLLRSQLANAPGTEKEGVIRSLAARYSRLYRH
jgi:hypothetical protein